MVMTVERKAYSLAECSMSTGLCVNTIRKLVKQGRIGHIKCDRRVLIPSDALDAFLHQETEKRKNFLERIVRP